MSDHAWGVVTPVDHKDIVYERWLLASTVCEKSIGPPYNTKYDLFLMVLCKSCEKFSHWLGLDDLFARLKPNQYEIFSHF